MQVANRPATHEELEQRLHDTERMLALALQVGGKGELMFPKSAITALPMHFGFERIEIPSIDGFVLRLVTP